MEGDAIKAVNVRTTKRAVGISIISIMILAPHILIVVEKGWFAAVMSLVFAIGFVSLVVLAVWCLASE